MHDTGLTTLKEWIRALSEAVIIIALMFVFLWPVQVEGVSMYPLIENGDRVAICRFAGKTGMYDRGDIVVFRDDNYPENMIKRIIAVGGDTLKIENGTVFVNGAELNEVYAKGFTEGEYYDVVPSDSVFVMGDNREMSIDSREFGTVKKDKIYGRLILRFYPFNKIKIF